MIENCLSKRNFLSRMKNFFFFFVDIFPQMEDLCEEENMKNDEKQKKRKLKETTSKAGVVYLSRIPRYMNVKILKERLSYFGEVGRIYLQADGKSFFVLFFMSRFSSFFSRLEKKT